MKYKLFLVKYRDRNGFPQTETRVAISEDAIRLTFRSVGIYEQYIDITELENEVIVYVDIKNVVVN